MRNRDRSRRRTGSAGSILSIGSSGSILSIGSAGSILSIGSAGSILSIGSVGSLASVLSVGSFASAGSVLSGLSRWSVLAWQARQPPAIPWPRSSQSAKALSVRRTAAVGGGVPAGRRHRCRACGDASPVRRHGSVLVAWEAEEDGSADDHHDERGDRRQDARPRTRLAVPVLAEVVIHRPHPQEHADLQAPRYGDRPALA